MPSRPTEIESAARLWSPIARFIEVEKRLGRWAERRGRGSAYGYEFSRFGIKYVMVAAVHGPQPIRATCEDEKGAGPLAVVAEAAGARN